MKSIFLRKPAVYLVYVFLFFIFQYLFFKLFFDCNSNEPNLAAADDNSEHFKKSERLVNDYYNRIVELKNEIELLKTDKATCSVTVERLERLLKLSANSNNNPAAAVAVADTNSDAVQQCEGDHVGETFLRDFYRYECKKISRYGAGKQLDMNTRIDGAYYVCEDGNLKPQPSNCVVLSFGIYNNDNFDDEIHSQLDCLVHSMDPFNEPLRVQNIRSSNAQLRTAVTLDLAPKWKYHSLGITNGERIRDVHKMGWLDTYQHILEYLNLTNTVIDVFKIDTEGAEWESIPYIMSTNPDLLCKYVKQMAIETHSWLYTHQSNYKVLKSLEKCFRLYKRDHRFYILNGDKTEWTTENFQLPLKPYKDEIELARFLFLYGELYFINKNFL